MLTQASNPASRSADTTVHARTTGAIVIATDGTDSADPAFTVARLIAGRTGGDVQVLSVLEPLPAMVPSPEVLMPFPDPDPERVSRLAGHVRHQLRRLAGEHAAWSIEFRRGRPAKEIAHFANERRAQLIVTGLNRHGVLERMLGEETPLHVAEATNGPVLAVAPEQGRLPKSIIVALDLESPGVDWLRELLAVRVLFAEATTVYCVHVVPQWAMRGPQGVYWSPSYGEAVRRAFDQMKGALALPEHVHIELITPVGNPAREILDFAAYVKVDLIVAGRRRRGALRRALLGSVASRLLRGAGCSVLLLPEPALELGAGRTEATSEPARWSTRLQEFTRRNAGRRSRLEVDDGDLGAQALAHDYPLLGVDYDEKDERVEIMLGDRAGGRRHLTHRIEAPTAIGILEGHDASDDALRIAYDGGQVLLTFES